MKLGRVSVIFFALTISILALGAVLGLFVSRNAQADSFTLYVSPDAACGVVVPCYGSIQEAVDAADFGNIIKVSQGTYTGTSNNVLVITKALKLEGGYSTVDWGSSLPKDQPTIVDGENERRGVYIMAEKLSDEFDWVNLDGFTIKNGKALTGGGSGINIISSTVSVGIDNCLIFDNQAITGTDNLGGGLAINGGYAQLMGNTVSNNKAGSGAGLSINSADVDLYSNEISGNKAATGGGLHAFGEASVNLFENKIIDNEAEAGKGPGILIDDAAIKGDNNIIADNGDSQGDGEGINVWTGTISGRHWTVVNNDAIGLVASNGSVNLMNSIVADHSTAGLFGDVVTANRTLFFNNTADCSSGASCSNSLTGDPRFVDPVTFNYHIETGSAAIDVGIDSFVGSDIDGESRPSGKGYDIGADELHLYNFLPTIIKTGS